jgi:TetR/AcrR family transcriptional regulator
MPSTQDASPTPERRILDAALDTIAEHKISGTRMRHIAVKAGMSQGNLHYYFPTKADLFRALLDDMLASFVSERERDVTDETLAPERALEVFFLQERKILRQRSKIMIVFFDFWVQGTRDPTIREQIRVMNQAWREDMERVVQRGVKMGAFDPTRAAQVPALMVSIMDGGALQYLIQRESFDLDGYLTSAYVMVLHLLSIEGTARKDS